MMEGQEEPQQNTHVGGLLRACRLRARTRLEDVAPRLHIRQPFLEAIESGRYEQLPGAVYAQGFVRAYAEYLGLDGSAVATRFKREITGWPTHSPLRFPLPPAGGETPRGGVLLLGLLIATISYGVWYVMTSRSIDMAQQIAPPPERMGGTGAPPSMMLSVRMPEATFAASPPAGVQAPVQPSAVSDVPGIPTVHGPSAPAVHAAQTAATEPVVAAKAAAVDGKPKPPRGGEGGAVHQDFPSNPEGVQHSGKTSASR